MVANIVQDSQYLAGLSDAQRALLISNSQRASAGVPGGYQALSSNRKVYVVAFDGTGNNADDPNKPQTNVSHLANLARAGLGGNGTAAYYAGPGNQENWGMMAHDTLTGQTMMATAATAYKEFVAWATEERAKNPNVEISLAGFSFSRGGGTHTAFLNMVWEKGIPDESSRKVTYIPRFGEDGRQWNEEVVEYDRYIVQARSANLGQHAFFDKVLGPGHMGSEILRNLPNAPADKLRALEIIALNDYRRDLVLLPGSNQHCNCMLRAEFQGERLVLGGGLNGLAEACRSSDMRAARSTTTRLHLSSMQCEGRRGK